MHARFPCEVSVPYHHDLRKPLAGFARLRVLEVDRVDNAQTDRRSEGSLYLSCALQVDISRSSRIHAYRKPGRPRRSAGNILASAAAVYKPGSGDAADSLGEEWGGDVILGAVMPEQSRRLEGATHGDLGHRRITECILKASGPSFVYCIDGKAPLAQGGG